MKFGARLKLHNKYHIHTNWRGETLSLNVEFGTEDPTLVMLALITKLPAFQRLILPTISLSNSKLDKKDM